MRIIRGIFGRRRFDPPANIKARPTTDFARENIFNVIENIIDIEDTTVLDLFAGTGAISFEFLSRGAKHVTSVEKAGPQIQFIKKVASQLDILDKISIIRADALKYINCADTSFDIIFADPPYDMAGFAEIPQKIISSPLVRKGTLFIIEHNRTHDFSHLPGFIDHRTYGSVNFSIFRL